MSRTLENRLEKRLSIDFQNQYSRRNSLLRKRTSRDFNDSPMKHFDYLKVPDGQSNGALDHRRPSVQSSLGLNVSKRSDSIAENMGFDRRRKSILSDHHEGSGGGPNRSHVTLELPTEQKRDESLGPRDKDGNKQTGIIKLNGFSLLPKVTRDEANRGKLLRAVSHKRVNFDSHNEDSNRLDEERQGSNQYFQKLKDQAQDPYSKFSRENALPGERLLHSILTTFNKEKRYEKAARHLKDAMYLRSIRHDVDKAKSKTVKVIYLIQTHPYWQTFIYLLTWLYLGVGFMEAPHSSAHYYHEDPSNNTGLAIALEVLVIVFYLIEIGFEIYHKSHDSTKTFREKYIKNKKVLSKVIVNSLFVLDLLISKIRLPLATFRFSKLLRPFCLALYSKQLRRTFTGIVKSIAQMVDILIFFLMITAIFALIGVRIIGDLDGEVEYDKFINNFADYGAAINSLYVLFSNDVYPQIMIPAVSTSFYYLIFFIPFVAINILLLVPIPIAVIFDAFRGNRGALVLKERVKEREALFTCFLCIDMNNKMSVTKQEFLDLFRKCYQNIVDQKIEELFDALDGGAKGYLMLEEFFEIIDYIENNKTIFKQSIIEVKAWNMIRGAINKIFRFDKISNSPVFDLIMNLVVLFNTAILIYYTFETNKDTLELLDQIDNILVYIYCAEVGIKLLGLGIFQYFGDSWNVMDFILTILSIATNVALSFAKFARSAKAGRLVRVARAQRAVKLLRVIRGLKLCKCCMGGWRSINRVKKLTQKIVICFPIVLKLAVILFMIFYFFAIIGMEVFHNDFANKMDSEYMPERYTSFDSLGFALLTLFQVVTQNQWSNLLFDYADRFGSLAKASLFFNSFHAISNLVIISLLTGLIWEVFTFVGKDIEQKEENSVVDDLENYPGEGNNGRRSNSNDPNLPPDQHSQNDIVGSGGLPRDEASNNFFFDEDSERSMLHHSARHQPDVIGGLGAVMRNSVGNAPEGQTDKNMKRSPTLQARKSEQFQRIDILNRGRTLNVVPMIRPLNGGIQRNEPANRRPSMFSDSMPSIGEHEIPEKHASEYDERGYQQHQQQQQTQPIIPEVDESEYDKSFSTRHNQGAFAYGMMRKGTGSRKGSSDDGGFFSFSQNEDLPKSKFSSEIVQNFSPISSTEKKSKAQISKIRVDLLSLEENENQKSRLTTVQPINLTSGSSSRRNLSYANQPSLHSSMKSSKVSMKTLERLPTSTPKKTQLRKRATSATPNQPGTRLNMRASKSVSNVERPKQKPKAVSIADIFGASIGEVKNHSQVVELGSIYGDDDPINTEHSSLDEQNKFEEKFHPELFGSSQKARTENAVIVADHLETIKSQQSQLSKSSESSESSETYPSQIDEVIEKATPKRGGKKLPTLIELLEEEKKKNSEKKEEQTVEEKYKSLEKEFFTKKIGVISAKPKNQNQFDFLYTEQIKTKIEREVVYLNLALEDEDSEDEEVDSKTAMQKRQQMQMQDKKKKFGRQSMTGDRILQKALLKGANQIWVQRYEDEYFRGTYGKWFEYLKKPKQEQILSLFEIENRITVRLQRLLRLKEIQSLEYMDIFSLIESSINKNLISRLSVCRFIFEDNRGRWFYLTKDGERLIPQEVKEGFWMHFQDVFPNKQLLYESQDVLYAGNSKRYTDVLYRFQDSLKRMMRAYDKDELIDFDQKENIYSLYTVPFESSSFKDLKIQTIKSCKDMNGFNINTIENFIIKRGVFLSLNYVKRTFETNQKQEQAHKSSFLNRLPSMAQRRRSRRKSSYVQKKAAVFPEANKATSQGRQRGKSDFSRIQETQKALRLMTMAETKSKKKITKLKEISTKAYEDEDGENSPSINKKDPSASTNFLPIEEYLDFLRDMRDLLNIHSDILLFKLSCFCANFSTLRKSTTMAKLPNESPKLNE